MGRKRTKEGSEGGGGSPKKKHKKNKHKKHHYVVSEEPEGSVSPNSAASSSFHRPITLKIKLGDRLISSSSTADLPLPDDTSSIAESEPQSLVAGGSSSVGGVDEEWEGSDISITQDVSEDEVEEEAWLDALEEGKVNERGYLPQKKDVSSLTARQRAMLGEGGGEDSQLMELPLVSKQAAVGDDEMTEEMLLKKTEKNRKRRLAAQKRKEKRKVETVRKLLEKQSTKKRDEDQVRVANKPTLPHMRYINTMRGVADGCGLESSLSLPPGMDFPLAAQKAKEPPSPVRCAVSGCTNLKKYSDPVTKLPLCSLECYKKSRASSDHCEQSLMIESPS